MPLATENGATHAGNDSKGRRVMRIILGAIAGVVVWTIIVTACDIAVRKLWIEYALVEKSLAFTLPMMIARLSESAACSVLSGFVAALIAKERVKSAAAAGLVLLAIFLPVHISIWHKLPVWYHLVFFASLPLLSLAGCCCGPRQFQSRQWRKRFPKRNDGRTRRQKIDQMPTTRRGRFSRTQRVS
ncbi:MAG: hypothetical protein WBE86_05885 [Candidatus Acidiferrales bacterium]